MKASQALNVASGRASAAFNVRTVLLGGLIALALSACGGNGSSGGANVGSAALLSIDADEGTLSTDGAHYSLSLAGANSVAVVFSDRPLRQATLTPLDEIVRDWDANGWNASPPSGFITVRGRDGGTWVEVFSLSQPRYDAAQATLVFTADSDAVSPGFPSDFTNVDVSLEPRADDSIGRIFSLPGRAGSIVENPPSSGPRSWTLRVDEIAPLAFYLWTGPTPAAGAIPIANLTSIWPGLGFEQIAPNASLTVRDGSGTSVAVLTLTDPVFDTDSESLSFTAYDIAGTADLPATFAESDLFIDSAGLGSAHSTAFTKLIGIDYDAEARCSDDNWSTMSPGQCNPQPSFMCDNSSNLAFCPKRCQACYDADLAVISGLGVKAITIYQPNYFILTAAQKLGVKVLLGTYNDTAAGLAKPDAPSGCTDSGFPTACGQTYAKARIAGACGAVSPWDPNAFCQDGTFLAPWKPFLDDGTVIGIQIGNELLANGFTQDQILAAAQTMRGVLDAEGYTSDKVPVVVSLVLGNETTFCVNGAPPPNVDLIAAHPYCASVANSPPTWPTPVTNCLEQVKTDFANISQKSCGADNVFIGETGLNTGCPSVYGATYVSDAADFTTGIVQHACQNSLGLFYFAFADACPAGGCLAGCPSQPAEGNGYFGLYSTMDYLTKGPLVPKFDPMPSLVCP